MPLIKIERVRFATDGSMATITRTSTSEFRAALIELLQTIAAGIIAGDATVVAAAEAAVDAALENADVARRSDPAYPWMTMGDPFIHWRDKNGYATFLDLSGGNGGIGGGGEATPLAGPIICAGDSLTANDNWVSVLAEDTFIQTVDLGQAGQSSTEIAFRLGALPVDMTVEGGAIPASGSVNVTAVSPSSTWRTTSVQWYVRGWLSGVLGTFWFKSATNPTPRFVRAEAGDPVTSPAGAHFTVAPDPRNRSGVGFSRMPLIYWSGRNNIADSGGIQRDDTAVMSHFTGKKMILAITNGTTERSNTAAYATIRAINARRASEYPDEFWDVREWLVHRAIYDMGLTPTSADLSNMALDAPPPQIMSDEIHFTAACSTALGHEIAFQLRKRGL
jgi:hypothetical protein